MGKTDSYLKRFLRAILGKYYTSLAAKFTSSDRKLHKSEKRLQKLRNLHQNERCFIICNGPSLAKTDLTLLKNEKTFGMNRIYLLFDDIGFETTYFVAVNKLVIQQCADEIGNITSPKFIPWYLNSFMARHPDVMFIRTLQDLCFSEDLTKGAWSGATVTYVAMQIAYYLGFQTVILVGADHDFKTKGKPHEEVISEGDDRDHFAPDYFGKGFRWNLPDLETSELAYRIAKYCYERDGRKILDATIGGKLKVFPKVDYDSLF